MLPKRSRHPVLLWFNCCSQLLCIVNLPDIKPIKLGKIYTKEFSITQLKLDEYLEKVDKLSNQPFNSKHIPWCTYFTITVLAIIKRCRRCTNRISITAGSASPPPPDRKRFSIFLKYFSRRRPNINASFNVKMLSSVFISIF